MVIASVIIWRRVTTAIIRVAAIIWRRVTTAIIRVVAAVIIVMVAVIGVVLSSVNYTVFFGINPHFICYCTDPFIKGSFESNFISHIVIIIHKI